MSNTLKWVFQRLSVLLLAFSLLFTVGCDDDDDPTSPDHDHFDAVGVYISNSGAKVFDYYGPDHTANDILGPVSIKLGDNGHWDVQFYNSSKALISGPDDTDHYLVVEIKNASVAALVDPHSEWRDTPSEVDGWMQYRYNSGVYDFHLNGLALNDSTNMRIKVFHVDHADFTTLEIKLKVDQASLTTRKATLNESDAELAAAYEDAEPANTYYPAGTKVSGSVSLTTSGVKTLVTKFFSSTLDAAGGTLTDGSQFQPAMSGHGLKVTSSDPTVVSVGTVSETNPGGTGTANLWQFSVTGLKAGTCELTVQITDAASGNVARTFHKIPVTVN